jgi:CheY-like chemotaxis protein
VLIADDNVDAARSLGMILEMGGHDVRTASNGGEALELLQGFRPQVALIDLSMPVVDGFELCRRIRQEPWGSELTLVALTGWGQPVHRAAAQEAGFDRHLVKPVDPGQLLQLVANIAVA